MTNATHLAWAPSGTCCTAARPPSTMSACLLVSTRHDVAIVPLVAPHQARRCVSRRLKGWASSACTTYVLPHAVARVFARTV